MNELTLILVFIMACYLSFKGGIKYGQHSLYLAMMSLPKDEMHRLMDSFRKKYENAINRKEGD